MILNSDYILLLVFFKWVGIKIQYSLYRKFLIYYSLGILHCAFLKSNNQHFQLSLNLIRKKIKSTTRTRKQQYLYKIFCR